MEGLIPAREIAEVNDRVDINILNIKKYIVYFLSFNCCHRIF